MSGPDEGPDDRAVTEVVVDGANVVGSRPDGWWRDRAGAARRLAARLVAGLDGPGLGSALGVHGGYRVHLVLEGAAARAADLPEHPRLLVHHAPADGDATIAALAGELGGTLGGGVLVVTADRALRARVIAVGARVTGPATLLGALPG
ncbi:hypothetical protein [Pseudonocardia sp.]|uniref:hypothetical protein n=1 Tax=Pseudonocardia sp. TaxID=60912 RepID=UPI003D0BB890